MRLCFRLLFTLACALTFAVRAPAQIQDSKATAAIQSVLDQQVESWNHGDVDGFMNGYWHSPELIYVSNKKVVKGWETLLDKYRQQLKGNGVEMGKLELTEVKIDILDHKAALVWGSYRVATSDGNDRGGFYTLAMRRFPEGWRTVYDRTSSEKEPAH